MMRLIFVSLMIGSPALAQQPTDAELTAAHVACQQHITIHNPGTSPYLPGWEKCATIETAWQQTDAAKRMQEQRNKENVDKALIESLSGRIK